MCRTLTDLREQIWETGFIGGLHDSPAPPPGTYELAGWLAGRRAAAENAARDAWVAANREAIIAASIPGRAT